MATEMLQSKILSLKEKRYISTCTHWQQQSWIWLGQLCRKSTKSTAKSPVHTGDKVESMFDIRATKSPTFNEFDQVQHVQLRWQCGLWHGRQSWTSRWQSTFDKRGQSRKSTTFLCRPCRVSTLLPVYTGLYVFVQEVVWLFVRQFGQLCIVDCPMLINK